jgi:hypothetical protein
LCHSTLGFRVIKEKKKRICGGYLKVNFLRGFGGAALWSELGTNKTVTARFWP